MALEDLWGKILRNLVGIALNRGSHDLAQGLHVQVDAAEISGRSVFWHDPSCVKEPGLGGFSFLSGMDPIDGWMNDLGPAPETGYLPRNRDRLSGRKRLLEEPYASEKDELNRRGVIAEHHHEALPRRPADEVKRPHLTDGGDPLPRIHELLETADFFDLREVDVAEWKIIEEVADGVQAVLCEGRSALGTHLPKILN